MHIILVGLNHKVAPVEVRERLSVSPEDLSEALAGLRKHVSEGAILSTCNRTEVYGLASHPGLGAQALRKFLSERASLELTGFDLYLYSHHEEQAVRHLFRVAAGLDSMLLGEPQILGQVTSTYEAAAAHNAVGPVLSSLFRQAISTGKRVRTETAISQHAVSVSYAAVELARKICGTLEHQVAVIVGAGEMAELALKTLVDNGVGQVLVTNRTYQRALELADHFSGEAVDYAQLQTALARADIIISSTAARDFILTVPLVRAAMKARGHRPLLIVDIAVPRDVDPAVQNLDNVFLYDVDDLESVCQANLLERGREAKQAEAIVEEEVQKFKAWFDTLEVVPTISALYSWAENIRQAEMAKAMSRIHGISDRDLNTINALSVAIVNKMLHPAALGLKNGGRHHARVLRELFRLDDYQTK